MAQTRSGISRYAREEKKKTVGASLSRDPPHMTRWRNTDVDFQKQNGCEIQKGFR